MLIDVSKLKDKNSEFRQSLPFPHLVIDDFIERDFAEKLSDEFPDLEDLSLFKYDNPLEKKSALNDWNKFPAETYKFLQYLCSSEVVSLLSDLVGVTLYPDYGLHGGGWHLHGNGGKLNPHLDYNIHPKLGLQRRINLICYLSKDWKDEYGGHFGLWSNDSVTGRPQKLEKEVSIKFNRAVIFDTTHNSWHGLSRPITSADNQVRKSLAVYYLCDAPAKTEHRERALYAPTEEQLGNKDIEELIKKRSDNSLYKNYYRTDGKS